MVKLNVDISYQMLALSRAQPGRYKVIKNRSEKDNDNILLRFVAPRITLHLIFLEILWRMYETRIFINFHVIYLAWIEADWGSERLNVVFKITQSFRSSTSCSSLKIFLFSSLLLWVPLYQWWSLVSEYPLQGLVGLECWAQDGSGYSLLTWLWFLAFSISSLLDFRPVSESRLLFGLAQEQLGLRVDQLDTFGCR